jgi:hypothetical protein
MGSVMDYIILVYSDPNQLELEVCEKLAGGYKLNGGVAIAFDGSAIFFAQSLVMPINSGSA